MKPAPSDPRSSNRILGRSVARLEDPPLLTGRGAFVGDIGFPHQLHVRIVRSAYANAVLRSVNVAAALVIPLTRAPEPVGKQVMGLQLAEPSRPLPRPIAQGAGHRQLRIVVEDRLRYAA